MTGLWRKLLGTSIYLLFLFAVVEVALQAFYYFTAGDFLFVRTGLPIWAAEPHAGIGNRPGLELDHYTNEFRARYFNNRAGFRVPRPDLEYAQAKPDDTFRVMLLGPSFAYGWGVDYEQAFASLLERRLAERGFGGGKKIEVINAGVPSLPAAPHLAWFEQVGAGYAPDLVIQLINASLTVSNDPKAHATVTGDGYIVRTGVSSERHLRDLVKKSATVFYGWVLSTKLGAARSQPGAKAAGGQVLGAGRELALAEAFDPERPEVAEAIAYYDHLARAVREAGAELQVVYFPLSYVVHREDERRWRHLGVRDVEQLMTFDADFARYLNERGIPVVDITPELRAAAGAGQRLYYWLDIHWTPEGNAVAANAVAEHLRARWAAAPGS